jgi:hypothetical protein
LPYRTPVPEEITVAQAKNDTVRLVRGDTVRIARTPAQRVAAEFDGFVVDEAPAADSGDKGRGKSVTSTATP